MWDFLIPEEPRRSNSSGHHASLAAVGLTDGSPHTGGIDVQLGWVEDPRIPPHAGLAGEAVAVLSRQSEQVNGASIGVRVKRRRLNETSREEQKPSALEIGEIEHASSSPEPLRVASMRSKQHSSSSSEEGLTGMPAASLEAARISRAVSPGGASRPDLGPGGPPLPEDGRHTKLTNVECEDRQQRAGTAEGGVTGAHKRAKQQQ